MTFVVVQLKCINWWKKFERQYYGYSKQHFLLITTRYNKIIRKIFLLFVYATTCSIEFEVISFLYQYAEGYFLLWYVGSTKFHQLCILCNTINKKSYEIQISHYRLRNIQSAKKIFHDIIVWCNTINKKIYTN